jgi:hypothetical protein
VNVLPSDLRGWPLWPFLNGILVLGRGPRTSFECSSAGCGLRVVVGASSKFATSQSSQSETNAREVQMLLLRSGHSRGPRRLHICVHTCTTHLLLSCAMI